jgi:hypothetical protein
MTTTPADTVGVVSHADGIRRITAPGAPLMLPLTLPALPLIGPRCIHAQPFARADYTPADAKCPLCGLDVALNEIAIDGITLALRRILETHDVPDRVIVTDDGMWSPVTGSDVFSLSHLSTDAEAIDWLNAASFAQLRELPGVDFATASALVDATPVSGTLPQIASRFMGPYTAKYRLAFITAVRGHQLKLWQTPPPPDSSVTTMLTLRTYAAGQQHFTPETTGILAAIALRIRETVGDLLTTRFVHAIRTGNVAALITLYRRVWPSTTPSVEHHLLVVEPHLHTMAVYHSVFGMPVVELD